MSKLTLDEAIKHCLETAEQLEERANIPYKVEDSELQDNACKECAADHRQLAEWLMELKDLRAEQNEQYVFIRELMDELEEVKRLLKAAVDDINLTEACDTCEYHHANSDMCQKDDCYKWRYADEVKKLLEVE